MFTTGFMLGGPNSSSEEKFGRNIYKYATDNNILLAIAGSYWADLHYFHISLGKRI